MRAMDTVTDFVFKKYSSLNVTKYVVAGASKVIRAYNILMLKLFVYRFEFPYKNYSLKRLFSFITCRCIRNIGNIFRL